MKETSVIKPRASAPLKQEVQPSLTMWKKKKKKKKKGRETLPIFYQRKRIPRGLESNWSKNKLLYVTCSSAKGEDGYDTTFLEQALKARFKSDCIIVLLLQ